jgi:diguanylate cyclase
VRYTETSLQSAELLRQALRYMAKHGGTYHPTHYALWYEYLAETFPALRATVDARLAEPVPLTASEWAGLYEDLSATRDNERAERLRDGVLTLLARLGQAAANVGNGSERFAEQLAAASQRLTGDIGPEGLTALLGELSLFTESMRQSSIGLTSQIRASQTEISELKVRLDEAHSAASLDPLTSLHNRRGFDRAISSLQSTDPAGFASGTLLMADIDHFKRINDNYGHLVGDQVIKAVARVLVKMTKGGDILFRFGGEEFAALLPSTTALAGLTVAEQLRAAVARILVHTASGEPLTGITISLGVAEAMVGESMSAWIERTDKALYKSKQDGRNRVTSWAPGL